MRDEMIPGRATVDDWEPEPKQPLSIVSWDAWRDGWGTTSFVIQDQNEHRYGFFFDGHLGRLCSGTGTHRDADAAFVKKGSRLMRDVIAVLQSERTRKTVAGKELAKHLDRALVYSGVDTAEASGSEPL